MKKFSIAVMAIFFLTIFSINVFAQADSAVLIKHSSNMDRRVIVLENYLVNHDSPLSPYAQDFIEAADYYGIDWRLIPAITGIESSFGKHMPYNSYNAYGWNGGDYQFKSWNDSIWHVAEVLKTKYFDRGAKSIPQIARIYAPPSTIWAGAVIHFTTEIEQASNLVPTL